MITYFLVAALTLLILHGGVLSQEVNKIDKVVIDPGHGGKDPGALGRNSMEKDIVLSIGLKTGKYIRESFPDVEVIFTRQTDEFIELHKRAQIANEAGADLFISIHCNSNNSSAPFGAETYVMGLHKSTENLEVAKTENAAIFYEDDYKTQYEGFDPNSDEDYIILSMFQTSNLEQSINLSSKVQEHFSALAGRKDRGVKQAGFWVLYKTTMPGILVEAGFLSNPEEERFLMSDEGQESIARSVFKAFRQYKMEVEEISLAIDPVIKKQKNEPGAEKKEVLFRVQFASYKREKSLDFRKFRGLKDIRVYHHDGLYKYTTGNERSIDEARKLKDSLLSTGYKDVFIVAFIDEERAEVGEALKALESNK